MGGVLMDPCDRDYSCNLDENIFKGIFARNLRYLIDVTTDKGNLQTYWKFLQNNIEALEKRASCQPGKNQGPDSIGKKIILKILLKSCVKVKTKNSRNVKKSEVDLCLPFKLGFQEDFQGFFPINLVSDLSHCLPGRGSLLPGHGSGVRQRLAGALQPVPTHPTGRRFNRKNVGLSFGLKK